MFDSLCLRFLKLVYETGRKMLDVSEPESDDIVATVEVPRLSVADKRRQKGYF